MADNISAYAVTEIRAELGRQNLSLLALARKCDVHRQWIRRRLREGTGLSLDDLQLIADALGKPASQFLPPENAARGAA